MLSLLVSGSAGLVGSEVARLFHANGFRVHGVDSNERAVFLGADADTRWNQRHIERELSQYRHYDVDIRDRAEILRTVELLRPSMTVHCAAQPSHDRAAAIPFDDHDVNATGTLNLLEAARRFCPESPFVYLSTNKVYGDWPNRLAVAETASRWVFTDPEFANGIPETLPVDQSTHSLFGVSKLAADLAVQEYGRYFGMPTCCLRAGCLTGARHSAVELHGFLSYLVRCNVERREYRVFGYGGKQVRDNLDASDVAAFALEFYRRPRIGEVYNLGGGRENSCSILEAFGMAAAATGVEQLWSYVEQPRRGDHICYYSDLRKVRSDYPQWRVTKSLDQIVSEIVVAWERRASR